MDKKKKERIKRETIRPEGKCYRYLLLCRLMTSSLTRGIQMWWNSKLGWFIGYTIQAMWALNHITFL
jgi:hypothetical protein